MQDAMPRSRSRSRGRRDDDNKRDDDKKGPAEAAKAGNSEQEIVTVAIKQLPAEIRERLEKLFEEGLLKDGDLDLRSITVFASLNEGLQARVMNHMELERIYVANARSKSGFLIATCDKAKTGCLDARGLGAIDPWRTALVAMATPKQKILELKPERDWLDDHEDKGGGDIKIKVNTGSAEKELGMDTVTVEVPMNETVSAVKAKLAAMGCKSIPANRMKLHTDPVGFLKERFTFAYYNLEDGVSLTLSERKRAGTKFRKDHTVMPKRPKTQPAPGEAPAAATGPAPGASPMDALKALGAPPAGAKLPALPGLPKLPGMSLPGLPGLPGMPALPGMPKLPGLPGLPGSMPMPSLPGLAGSAPAGLPGLPKMPGLPGLPALPGLGGTGPAPGGLPGLPDLKADPKMAAMAAMMADMAKAKGGMPPGLMPPGLGGAMPKGGDAPQMKAPMPDMAAMAKMMGMMTGMAPMGATAKGAPMA